MSGPLELVNIDLADARRFVAKHHRHNPKIVEGCFDCPHPDYCADRDIRKPLNARQQRFVDEYLVDLNATQAALRAGYSPKTAHVIGSENLKKPAIAAVVAEALSEKGTKTRLTELMVIEGLLEIACDWEAPRSARVSAWGLLGKHLGMFKERLVHEGGIDVRTVDALDAEIARLAVELGQNDTPTHPKRNP